MNEKQPKDGTPEEVPPGQTLPATEPAVSSPLPWLIRNLIHKQGVREKPLGGNQVTPKPTGP